MFDYSEIINQNQKLIELGNYEEALLNLKIELQQPYIPLAVENELQKMYQIALKKKLLLQSLPQIKDYSAAELLT